jgi:hypothetical protein
MRSPPSEVPIFDGCHVEGRLRIESVPRQVKEVGRWKRKSVPGGDIS